MGDIAAGGYRSRRRERPVLERHLSRNIAAGGYRSPVGPEKKKSSRPIEVRPKRVRPPKLEIEKGDM